METGSGYSTQSNCGKSCGMESVNIVNEHKPIADEEHERIARLLEQYGWEMNTELGVVDSMSKVMSYVRTGSIENEMYYATRFRDVRAELRKAKPNAPRPLKEELCAIAFNCNILVALPLVDFNQVDTFKLEKPVGVLPEWLRMSELSTTLTIASFPAADRESSLYAILQCQAPVEGKPFRRPQLVRTFPGFRAVPSKRKSIPDLTKTCETLVIAEKAAIMKSNRDSKFSSAAALEVATAS